MNYGRFISLFRKETQPAPRDSDELRQLLKDYPWFQSARLLLARLESKNGIPERERRLLAIYAPDRKHLRNVLTVHDSEPASPTQHTPVAPVVEKVPIAPEASGVFTAPPEENIFRPQPAPVVVHAPVDTSPPVMPVKQEPVVAATSGDNDPHEIIRRRLEEIFSAKPAVSPAEPDVAPATPGWSFEPLPVPSISEEQIATEASLPEVPETIEFSRQVLPAEAEEVLIRKEYMQLQDELDREELVHAAEETVVQAIENMPPAGEAISFIAWLKRCPAGSFGTMEEVRGITQSITVFEPASSETPGESPSSQAQLIEKFIAAEPRITPSRVEFYSPAIQARRSVEEDEDMVTETLAGIYLEQGLLAKARHAYERLSLLYPEKSSSFAALIQKIDSLNTEE